MTAKVHTRRRFVTFLVAAPTLTVAARLLDAPAGAQSLPAADLAEALQPQIDAVALLLKLRVTEDNKVVLECPRAEVGQGITTALAMMVAEDIDARLGDVDVPLSDARAELGAAQLTGGSTSVRNMWGPVRKLAAEARARLVTAAAERWGLAAGSLTTRDTAVWAPDGRTLTYGELSTEAAKITIPAVAGTPKALAQHRVIGKPTLRVDGKSLVTGVAQFAMDINVPGALPTVIKRPPTIGGKVAGIVNGATVRAMPGVVAVTTIPTGVAVSAKTFHHALQARDALQVNWGSGPVDGMSDSTISSRLKNAALPFALPPLGQLTVDATFEFAFVNHAPMEVNCAIADVRSGSAVIWCPSKSPNIAKTAVGAAILMPETAITVHVTRAGGSFGRKVYSDAAVEAAQISKAIGEPVKLMWTRTDDMKHGRMRPASFHRLRATALAGNVLTFENRSSAVQMDLDMTPFSAVIDPGFGGLPTAGAAFFAASQATPYSLGVPTTVLNEVQLPFPTGTWRSVYSGHNRAAEEIMIDRLATKLGKDPLAFRTERLGATEAKTVMQQLKTRGAWGRAMPAGWAQGVGFHAEYNAHCGCLVELDATTPSKPRVTKAVVVVDMGRVVNPTGASAQLMGSVMDGISTILQAGNHISNGAVTESSFADFRWARQRHAPLQFDVQFLNTGRESGGAGELAVPAAAGAVANAYARATGTAPSRFPILA
jgi:isoquinoline 1-oxidoreductase beta subunit